MLEINVKYCFRGPFVVMTVNGSVVVFIIINLLFKKKIIYTFVYTLYYFLN